MTKISRPSFEKVLDAFQKAKVINESTTLKQLAEVSKNLPEPGDLTAWTFVSPNYVYTGDDTLNSVESFVK